MCTFKIINKLLWLDLSLNVKSASHITLEVYSLSIEVNSISVILADKVIKNPGLIPQFIQVIIYFIAFQRINTLDIGDTWLLDWYAAC